MTYKDEAKASRVSKRKAFESGGAVFNDRPSQSDQNKSIADQRSNRGASSIRTLDPGKGWSMDRNVIDSADANTDFKSRQEDI